jgi:hypothetical protein
MKSYVFMDRINRIYQLVLYQIRHFAAVAETGSFTKAATSLRTETADMTILCFALSNDRVRTRDEGRFFALTQHACRSMSGSEMLPENLFIA